MTKHRKFSREFKLSVIRELENGTDIAKICRKYNIYKSLPGKWKQEFNKDPRTAFTGKKIIDKDKARIEELEQLVGKLYAENAFLKKTLASLEERLIEVRKKNKQR